MGVGGGRRLSPAIVLLRYHESFDGSALRWSRSEVMPAGYSLRSEYPPLRYGL